MNEYTIISDDLKKINDHLYKENIEFKTIQDFLHFLHGKWLLTIKFHVDQKQK